MPTNPYAALAAAPTPQLAYNNNFSNQLPGSIADSGEHDIITAISTTQNAVMGTVVVADPSVVQGWKYATSSGDVAKGVLGMVLRTGAIESRRDGLPPSYGLAVPANILRFGRGFSAPEVAVSKHDPVYVRITANGALSQLGALRNDDDSGKAVLVPNAKWAEDVAEAASGRIEFNLLGA